jgi:branched-chain amino acid transport system ATP-binding protein
MTAAAGQDDVLLDVRGLRKSFGGLVAVRDMSLIVPARGVTGLIGPNGSGKTTVLNLITGELRPDQGAVLLKGQSIFGWAPFRINRARIARTFQLVRLLPNMTVQQNVMVGRMFGADPTSPASAVQDAIDLLKRVGLGGRENTPAGQLTYIDQKRLELARALATRPELLLLDEWLAGLNPTELQIGIGLVRTVSRDGIAIVMIEHVMEAIRALCDQVYVMNAGEKIAEGRPDAVLSDPRVMRAYLGADDAAA